MTGLEVVSDLGQETVGAGVSSGAVVARLARTARRAASVTASRR